MDVIDEQFGPYYQGWTFTRIYRLHGHTVRVRIKVDTSHAVQSHALVEVLTPGKTWTELADNPPALWHKQAPYHNDRSSEARAADETARATSFARALAAALALRAEAILDPTEV